VHFDFGLVLTFIEAMAPRFTGEVMVCTATLSLALGEIFGGFMTSRGGGTGADCSEDSLWPPVYFTYAMPAATRRISSMTALDSIFKAVFAWRLFIAALLLVCGLYNIMRVFWNYR
jgi:hypothetical protein